METAFQRIRAGGTAATPSNSSPTANNGTKTMRAAGPPGSAGVSAGGTAAVTRAPAASASAARTRWVTFAGLALRSDGWTFRLVRAGFLARRRAGGVVVLWRRTETLGAGCGGGAGGIGTGGTGWGAGGGERGGGGRGGGG